MASEQLLKFNEQFPNSMYREIHAQYTGPMKNDEDTKKYQQSKAPINKTIVSFDAIKDTKNRIGWIVPEEYIVVDIDKQEYASVVFKILKKRNIKFSYMKGRKGGHFIFKNQRGVKSISAGTPCSIGIVVDIRCMGKGYIILPENDTDRTWGTISNDIDDIPFFLVPQKDLKLHTEFLGMSAGAGRNDALHSHILALIDYAKNLSIDEKAESIKIINEFLFADPIDDKELEQTVLRQEILDRQEDEKEDKSCYEEKLAKRIIQEKQIITSNDTCYFFNGKYYKKLDDIDLERIIHNEYNETLKQTRRRECVQFIKLKSYVSPKTLNADWSFICFRNGILNINTMTLIAHTPNVYNTVYIDYDYHQDALYSPTIDDFFNTLSGCDEDLKRLLYEIVGCCLIRKNLFSKFFICYGQGQTGKSSYLRLIKNLIGKENASFLSINDLETTFGPVELLGKLANLGDDVPYYLKETATLKKVVTGEEMMADQKFKSPVCFENFATLVFTTNKLPEVSDKSSGFYRRLMIIQLDNKIEKPDIFFFDRLTDADYEYLLSKSIDAVLAAIKAGKLTEYADVETKIEEYRREQSSTLSFLNEYGYTKKNIDHRPCMVLFKEYEQYCHDVGFKPVKKINFDKEVCDELKMKKKNTTWSGETETNQTWRFCI